MSRNNQQIIKRRPFRKQRFERNHTEGITGNNQEIDWDLEEKSTLRYKSLGMPDEFRTNLVYDFFDYALVSAATSGTLKIAGNSLFDPDKTGTGHQPLFFDALGGGIYQRYRVLKSTVILTLLNTTQSCTVVITPSANINYPSTLNDALEARHSTQHIISSSVFQSQSTNKISTHKVWGVPQQVAMYDDLYQSLYTTDPTRLWYWVINCGVYDGSTSFAMRVNVKVIYDAIFSDLSVFSQS